MYLYLTRSRLHWVTPITSGERWSCTIFLEEDSVKIKEKINIIF